MTPPPARQAFSLVELSIVLVILGLLVGGVLTGQSLIRAAELRSVTTEYQKYAAAVHTFRDKYFALPGDMPNATSFWGSMTNCGAASPSGTGTQTCNGTGNGLLAVPAAASRTGEVFGFWQHLTNAGLIEGTYTGVSGASGIRQVVAGVNVPRSKLSGGAWYVEYSGFQDGTSWAWAGDYGHSFYFGAVEPTDIVELPILKPAELWNIDKKIDDGKPALGQLRSYRVAANCNTTTAQSSAAIAEYAVSNDSVACNFVIKSDY